MAQLAARDDIPWIISVDDHVTEPPDLWTSRLPRQYLERAPQVRRDKIRTHPDARLMQMEIGAEDGVVADYWIFDGAPVTNGILTPITHAIGYETRMANTPLTYEAVHPGSWIQANRLADMTSNHVEASLCFANVVPRYCAQTFLEHPDKNLGLACIQVYNDWMIDDWCGGDGKGRLIPLALVPLWDAELAASEVCAARPRAASPFPSARIRTTSACRRCTTRTATGIRSSAPSTRPAATSRCTSARATNCRQPRSTRPT